jgi:3-phosphoshikimate 1-carboxyvinyltransferase
MVSPECANGPSKTFWTLLRQLGVNACSEMAMAVPGRDRVGGLAAAARHRRGGTSSQFLSGLLMAAPPRRARKVTIEVEGELVSEPYVAMTVEMMRQWNLSVEVPAPGIYRIPAPQWQGTPSSQRPT